MKTTEFIVFGAILAPLLIWIVFRKYNKKNTAFFLKRVEKLKMLIDRNQKQIQRRQLFLNKYDFLKYNIREALKTQSNIKA